MDEKKQIIQPHNVVIEDRKRITVSAVRDVDSFDENNIIAFTPLGELTISGSELHINRFSTEEGELAVEGEIASVSYSDNTPTSGGFFSRIFR